MENFPNGGHTKKCREDQARYAERPFHQLLDFFRAE